MLDNVDIAILTKVNELAERHGLKPVDFVATVRGNPDGPGAILAFEVPAQGNALREARFDRMLTDIGVGEEAQLIASHAQVLERLTGALQKAPKLRPRY